MNLLSGNGGQRGIVRLISAAWRIQSQPAVNTFAKLNIAKRCHHCCTWSAAWSNPVRWGRRTFLWNCRKKLEKLKKNCLDPLDDTFYGATQQVICVRRCLWFFWKLPTPALCGSRSVGATVTAAGGGGGVRCADACARAPLQRSHHNGIRLKKASKAKHPTC